MEGFVTIFRCQWKQRIQYELDGADYNDSLIWNSPEDIKVKPFYNSDDLNTDLEPNTKGVIIISTI